MSLRSCIRLFVVSWLMPVWAAAQPNPAPVLKRFAFQRGLMGTEFNLILFAADSLTASRVNAGVSARMDSLNQILSDYLDGSEINRLSETAGSGRWVPVSPELFDVLRKARTIARLSTGRFDPTIGPLSQLWRRAVRRNTFPTASERRRARWVVGYRLLEMDGAHRAVKLRRAGMRLDVGGIGQGFAIDEAARVLRQSGVNAFLLDLGGDVLAGDAPPDQSGWRVRLDSATVWLKNAAITTSGDAYRHLDYRGRRYSHVMNPRSGLGLRYFVQATVLASDGYHADALTKVFSIARGWPFRWRPCRRLLNRFPGAEVLIWENKAGRLRRWQSAGFPTLSAQGRSNNQNAD